MALKQPLNLNEYLMYVHYLECNFLHKIEKSEQHF